MKERLEKNINKNKINFEYMSKLNDLLVNFYISIYIFDNLDLDICYRGENTDQLFLVI